VGGRSRDHGSALCLRQRTNPANLGVVAMRLMHRSRLWEGSFPGVPVARWTCAPGHSSVLAAISYTKASASCAGRGGGCRAIPFPITTACFATQPRLPAWIPGQTQALGSPASAAALVHQKSTSPCPAPCTISLPPAWQPPG